MNKEVKVSANKVPSLCGLGFPQSVRGYKPPLAAETASFKRTIAQMDWGNPVGGA